MRHSLLIIFATLFSSITIGQTTWYEIPTGTTKKLNAINFPSNNVGYIVGNDSLILKTIDGGQTWEQLPLTGFSMLSLSDDFTDVHFVDENIGFFVAGYSGIYKTIDGGQTWTQIPYSMCFPHAILTFTEDDYVFGGGDCFSGAKIDKTVNNVSTIATINGDFWNSTEVLMEFSFNDSNRGLAATRSPYMLRTVDAGVTWDTISTGISGELTSVLMINDTLCYAGYDVGGSSFGILKSIDGGLTWDFDPNLGTSALFINPNYLSICAAQNGDIYSGANTLNSSEGVIFETSDGIIWSNTYVDQPINAMTSFDSDITFGVGDSGYVVVNTPIENLGISSENLLEFTAYPNPVINELTIQNPNTGTMEVIILDATGRILKKESVPSGLSGIDCSTLKDGIYFVKVKVDERVGMKQFVKTN